ncbi:MAG: Gfo/Idh/MocA family oxidoreductase [Firmicutes bacterium]|nr:Gfo/Idh/MocA family oxidoreductase [Candidatus Colimorpha enterica]
MITKQILSVGVIGMGMGFAHAKSVAINPNAQLTWLCDIDAEKVKAKAEEIGVKGVKTTTDYKEMLKDPNLDAVIIASPDMLHKEMVEACVKAKKHVLCEKPLALTREDIDAIVAAANSYNKVFMVGQICRYTPGFVEAKKRIDAGEIGELTFVESEYAHDYTHIYRGGSWRVDPTRNGLVGGGCHAVDLLRWIVGKNPEVVTGLGTHKTFADVTPYDDTHVAILKFPDGVIGKVFCSISCRRDYTMRSVFYGTKGTIITDNTSPTMKVFHLNEDGQSSSPETVELNIKNHNTDGEFAEFCACIMEGKKNATPVEEGANTIAACLAIMESANAGGKPVKVKLFKSKKCNK